MKELDLKAAIYKELDNFSPEALSEILNLLQTINADTSSENYLKVRQIIEEDKDIFTRLAK